MQNINASNSRAFNLKSFGNIRTAILYCLAVWTIPGAADWLAASIPEGMNFNGMTIDQARAIAAEADLLIAVMLLAYVTIARRSRMIVLPFVLYFSWTAAEQFKAWFDKITNSEALFYLVFLALVFCGLGSIKLRQITAYALVLVNLYFLCLWFDSEVIHGSFSIPNPAQLMATIECYWPPL